MKKKLLSMLLIIVLVFNFICACPVYAEPDDEPTGIPESNGEGVVESDQVNNLLLDGKPSNGETISLGDAVLGVVFQMISMVFNSFPMAIHALLTQMTKNPYSTNPEEWGGVAAFAISLVDKDNFFTIERTVFGEVALFQANVFNTEDTYTLGISNTKTINQSPNILKLKESCASWFYTCRMLALMINALVLIYVGIRMAISTVASEEARYKKMLISWAESMVVLFLLHYIMALAIQFGEMVLNIIYELRMDLTPEPFETTIIDKVYNAIGEKTGMEVFMYSVFFWILCFMLIKFFLTYIKRVLSIMFLTIIGPFITVTYPIDKMGDGRAQAFEAWLKEYILNVAIQPIHAAIYLVFIYSAGVIAEKSPFVAMLFLCALGRIEKIVRNIFGLTDSVSVKNFSDELKKGKK